MYASLYAETWISFNTPNSENTATLFKRYLDVDIVKKWAWQAVSPDKAQKQLDALIKLRGRVVHKGRDLFRSQSQDVHRSDVVKALNLVYNLVYATELALGIAPKEVAKSRAILAELNRPKYARSQGQFRRDLPAARFPIPGGTW